MQDKILILIVLHKMQAEESIAYTSLMQTSEYLKSTHEIFLFNNYSDITIQVSNKYHVINSNKNVMLSGAYNQGLKYAIENSFQWMLLLDQDTELTKDYFVKINRFLTGNRDENTVLAVPRLNSNKGLISPHTTGCTGFNRKVISREGVYNQHLTALNSGSLLQVKFIHDQGGFSDKYPLDMLDYRTGLLIKRNKKSVAVLDTTLQHDLSVLNKKEYMSEARYKKLLQAEELYFREVGGLYPFFYKIRLLMRAVRQFLFFKNKKISYFTLIHLLKKTK